MTNTSANVQDFIDSRPLSRSQMIVIGLCILVSMVDAIDMMVMGLVGPSIADQWHISNGQLSWVISSSVIGTFFGAFVGGPAADRFGRRLVLLLALLSFGGLTLCCAIVSTVQWLVALRFIAGIGMGAAVPAAATLISEYAPRSYRAVAVNGQTIGFSIGASLSGMIAGSVIPKLGWEAMLVLAGILPLLVAAFAFFYLMESLDFMIRRKWKAQKISSVLERIEKGSAFMTQHLVFAEQQRTARRRGSLAGISGLFQHQFLPATLLLWALYFLGLLVYYFFSGWLPAITRDAGFSTTEGSWITALFPLGGAVGAVVIGYLLDKTRPRFVIGASYALSGIFIFLIGLVSTKALFLTPLVFLGGATLVGATFSLPAVAAGSYPTLIRATGVAWMLGVGRLGGITGSMVGGKLLSLHWLAEQIFQAASVPAFLAAALILCAASALPYGKDLVEKEQSDQIAINPHPSGSQPVK